MAATEQKFNIKVATQGTESLTTLKAKLANLGKEVNATKTGFQGAAAEIKKVQSSTDQSVNSLRNFASSWRELANSVSITSKEFRIYSREAEKAERIAARASGKRGGGLKGAAQTAGTVAAAGIFGGPEGAIGALIGSAGGPAGAAVGGAIGATVGGVRQALGAAAAYSAELDKQRTALRQVIGSQAAYDQSLKFVKQTSTELAIPQDIIIQNFTRLSASVIGAGGNINDAEKAFKGISAGILGTGGSLENLDSALLATAQVFSKGKVSAEELRGQIGERLPGAFTIFAESIGKTPQQLDKALQEGQVSLTDFQTFSEALFKRYGNAAKIIASSPENAGNRLKVTLSNLSENVGTLLRPIGAAFQNTFSFIAEIIDAAITKLNFFLKLDPTGRKASLRTQIAADEKLLAGYRTGQAGMSAEQKAKFAKAMNAPLESRLIANKALLASMGTPFREPGKGLGVSGDGGGGSGAASKAAENAAKRLAEQTKKQLDAAFKLNVLAGEKLDVQMSSTDEEKLQAELDKVAVERRLKFAELQKKALSEKERELLVSAQLSTIFIDNNKAQKAKADLLTKQTEELYLQIGLADVLGKKFQAALGGAFGGDGTAGQFRTDLNLMPGLTGGELGAHYEELQTQFKDLISASNQVKTAAESIGTAFGETFKGLITGSMGAREALAGFFQSIANHFADMASQMIAKYIQMQIIGLAQQFLPSIGGIFGAGGAPNFSSAFGGSGGFQKFTPSSQFMPGVPSLVGNRAVGGPIAGSGAYLVGERGPELFMPGRSGTIVPGGGMGGANVTVNVDANGTSVQGDQAQAKQLGVAVSAAVQAELVKQQRPGGLLAGTRR
jgi:tape measure domain-containing protein